MPLEACRVEVAKWISQSGSDGSSDLSTTSARSPEIVVKIITRSVEPG